MRVNLLEFIGRNFFLFNTSLHSNTRWSRLSSQEVSSCIRILKWWDQIKLTEFQYLCRCDQPILVIQPWDATDAQIREVSGQITNRHWDRQTPVLSSTVRHTGLALPYYQGSPACTYFNVRTYKITFATDVKLWTELNWQVEKAAPKICEIYHYPFRAMWINSTVNVRLHTDIIIDYKIFFA